MLNCRFVVDLTLLRFFKWIRWKFSYRGENDSKLLLFRCEKRNELISDFCWLGGKPSGHVLPYVDRHCLRTISSFDKKRKWKIFFDFFSFWTKIFRFNEVLRRKKTNFSSQMSLDFANRDVIVDLSIDLILISIWTKFHFLVYLEVHWGQKLIIDRNDDASNFCLSSFDLSFCSFSCWLLEKIYRIHLKSYQSRLFYY